MPLYLGLFLVLFAFFVYFVAASTPQRQTEAAVVDDPAADPGPRAVEVTEMPAPALRPLVEVFRPLLVPGTPGDRTPSERLDAAVAVDRMFVGDSPSLRPDFALVLDRIAKELSGAAASATVSNSPRQAAEDETLELHLLVGLPPAAGPTTEPAPVSDILAERLAVRRAATLARALLARGVPPASFAVGVAPAAGIAVRFLFRLDHRRAAAATF